MELVESLPDGIYVERAVYAGKFPGEEPYRQEIWLKEEGVFEFRREYYSSKIIDYDENDFVTSTHPES